MNTCTIIDNADKIDISKWNEFVFNHPDGNIFQTPHFYFLHKNYKYSDSVINIILDEHNKIIGLLLTIIHREGSGLIGKLTSRSISSGGPLVLDNNSKICRILLDEHDKEVRLKTIYSQFRNLFDLNSLKEIFLEKEYKYKEHLDIVIDLTKSEEILWSEVNQKARNRIRKAKKEGIHIELSNRYEDIKETYKILKEVYDRVKLPLPNYKYFEIAYAQLTDKHFKIFLAIFEKKIIGIMYTLCFKDLIYGWYSGSFQEYLAKCPNDLLNWEIIMWGKINGYNKFDLGGAGEPFVPYGVREYKKKFGGEMVNFGRFEKIHKPFLFAIAKIGFMILQKLKK